MTTNTEIFTIPFTVIKLLSELVSKYYNIEDVKRLLSHIDEAAYQEVSKKIKEPRTIEEIRADQDVLNSPLIGAVVITYNVEVASYLKEIITQFLEAINSAGNDTEKKLHILIDDVENYIKQDDDEKLRKCLERNNISRELENRRKFIKGDFVMEAPSTRALQDYVKQHELSYLDRIIQQSLNDIDNNPLSAVLHASTTLESALKEYLETRQIPYNKDNATLPKLWDIFIQNNFKMHPEELNCNDLKKIATGLYNIIHGTASLRNKKSSAHGKSEEEFQTINITPRHARLAIHAAHTLSAYILELGEDQKKLK